MARQFCAALIVLACSIGSTAHANYTIDLIWADTGTGTLTVNTATAATSPAGTLCGDGLLSQAGPGRCLLVQFTADTTWTSAYNAVGWNAAASGIGFDWTGLRSVGKFAASNVPADGLTPQPIDPIECAGSGCDTAYLFGVLSGAAQLGGTFTIGSINFDTGGAVVGNHSILNFLHAAIGGVTDSMFVAAPVQFNGAQLNVIPEPSTAALVGLGAIAFAALGRRRRSDV